jgi:hypothetical protein
MRADGVICPRAASRRATFSKFSVVGLLHDFPIPLPWHSLSYSGTLSGTIDRPPPAPASISTSTTTSPQSQFEVLSSTLNSVLERIGCSASSVVRLAEARLESENGSAHRRNGRGDSGHLSPLLRDGPMHSIPAAAAASFRSSRRSQQDHEPQHCPLTTMLSGDGVFPNASGTADAADGIHPNSLPRPAVFMYVGLSLS